MRIAIVVYDGVLGAECEAFSSVLGLMQGAEVVTVGARRGVYAGPGGQQQVDLRFDEVDRVDVAIVPGGLGCERAADDPVLRAFLVRMDRSARYLAASSTGSVVLASAGLLHGNSAATHWLAGDLLRRYGSEVDHRRLVTTDNVITCEGQISAVDAALSLVETFEGPGAVGRIRATLIQRGQPHLRRDPWWQVALDRLRILVGAADRGAPVTTTTPSHASSHAPSHAPFHASSTALPARPQQPPITPLSVMIELVDNDDLARELKRSSRRRR